MQKIYEVIKNEKSQYDRLYEKSNFIIISIFILFLITMYAIRYMTIDIGINNSNFYDFFMGNFFLLLLSIIWISLTISALYATLFIVLITAPLFLSICWGVIANLPWYKMKFSYLFDIAFTDKFFTYLEFVILIFTVMLAIRYIVIISNERKKLLNISTHLLLLLVSTVAMSVWTVSVLKSYFVIVYQLDPSIHILISGLIILVTLSFENFISLLSYFDNKPIKVLSIDLIFILFSIVSLLFGVYLYLFEDFLMLTNNENILMLLSILFVIYFLVYFHDACNHSFGFSSRIMLPFSTLSIAIVTFSSLAVLDLSLSQQILMSLIVLLILTYFIKYLTLKGNIILALFSIFLILTDNNIEILLTPYIDYYHSIIGSISYLDLGAEATTASENYWNEAIMGFFGSESNIMHKLGVIILMMLVILGMGIIPFGWVGMILLVLREVGIIFDNFAPLISTILLNILIFISNIFISALLPLTFLILSLLIFYIFNYSGLILSHVLYRRKHLVIN